MNDLTKEELHYIFQYLSFPYTPDKEPLFYQIKEKLIKAIKEIENE